MDKQPQDYLPRQTLKFTGTFKTINSNTVNGSVSMVGRGASSYKALVWHTATGFWDEHGMLLPWPELALQLPSL